jgi:hypothetical protein
MAIATIHYRDWISRFIQSGSSIRLGITYRHYWRPYGCFQYTYILLWSYDIWYEWKVWNVWASIWLESEKSHRQTIIQYISCKLYNIVRLLILMVLFGFLSPRNFKISHAQIFSFAIFYGLKGHLPWEKVNAKLILRYRLLEMGFLCSLQVLLVHGSRHKNHCSEGLGIASPA